MKEWRPLGYKLFLYFVSFCLQQKVVVTSHICVTKSIRLTKKEVVLSFYSKVIKPHLE